MKNIIIASKKGFLDSRVFSQLKVRAKLMASNEINEELERRYVECDSMKHKSPSEKENRCGYCHRTLEIKTGADAILESRKDLHYTQVPMDAPVLMDMHRRELESTKAGDYLRGLGALADERISKR